MNLKKKYKSKLDKEIVTELSDVSKKFDNKIEALNNINIKIFKGDFITFLGPSGCGKSTIMKLLCGLIKPTSGYVSWPLSTFKNSIDNPVNLSVVFQEPTLLPWLTVFQNICLPLKIKNNEKQNMPKVYNCLNMVGLSKFSNLYPNQLSEGMKMRVSLARALVTDPKVLILDEPFAALDELTRFKLNDELLNIYERKNLTVIFITHSIFEAVYLSNKITLISNHPGKILEEINLNQDQNKNKNYRSSEDYLNKCKMISEKIYFYENLN